MCELAGKVAIVTGAARGTGAAIAKRFAVAGARVVLGDVQHALGEKVAAEIGAAARYRPLDVTREADWERVVAETLADEGRIDVLVNNAAILHMGARRAHLGGDAPPRARREHGRALPRRPRRARADAQAGRRRDRERGLDRLAARHERDQRVRGVEVGPPRAQRRAARSSSVATASA